MEGGPNSERGGGSLGPSYKWGPEGAQPLRGPLLGDPYIFRGRPLEFWGTRTWGF